MSQKGINYCVIVKKKKRKKEKVLLLEKSTEITRSEKAYEWSTVWFSGHQLELLPHLLTQVVLQGAESAPVWNRNTLSDHWMVSILHCHCKDANTGHKVHDYQQRRLHQQRGSSVQDCISAVMQRWATVQIHCSRSFLGLLFFIPFFLFPQMFS